MDLPGAPSPLLTDLYQITMAYAYWRSGMARLDACFHMVFRSHPFGGGYAVACGLAQAVEFLERLRFEQDDLAYLATLTGVDGAPLFAPEFLDWLADTRFSCDVDAVPEGTVVFPNEPTLRVAGPIAQAQLVETTLLNIVGFQTLVATKAARVCHAAKGAPVIEFGLRRAQGPDGGLSASRAAYVGGCVATSNVLAGKRYGIPVGGTHAHSWVMAFEREIDAFAAYADAMPNNCVLLVDTYDTLEGVRNAIEVGKRLAERGQTLVGIRIDSGDLAWFAARAREMLDTAGMRHVKIYASNELDEQTIEALKDQGAPIDVWGVGTKLATADGQPALGAVYKLSAVREPGGQWEPRIKVSEQSAKTTVPGVLQVRRFVKDGVFDGDMVFDETRPLPDRCEMVDPGDPIRRKRMCGEVHEDLLVPVFRRGERVYEVPDATAARARAAAQLAKLDPSVKRLVAPYIYPVGIESGLHELRTALIAKARKRG
ncbi:MAG: nicotinate phosphoribosyltransferase [Anaerosomatales bacterium]|nr:nicotinate phosphoribosyltransferase [Anaerosomatales bacterium]